MSVQHFIAPAESWTGGDFGQLIQTGDVPGPYQYPEDKDYMRHALSLLVHIYAMQRIYTKIEDHRQRQRWVQASDCFMDAVKSIFPASYQKLESEARKAVMAWDVSDGAGDEVSYASYCLFVVRQFEVGWHQAKMRKARQIEQCRACIVQAIRCAFPEECANELLSEEICHWSVDGVNP